MKKSFNISGPCNPNKHYMIEAATRLQGVESLIEEEQYFVIHAARQSGKTTYLKDLVRRLDKDGEYYTVYCSLESLQGIKDLREGIPEIVQLLQKIILDTNIPNKEKFAEKANYSYFTGVLNMELTKFCKILDKPLVILFDESDCLSEDTLISFLRQLREGYNNRDMVPFAHSIGLIGMRNIRDYKVKVRPESESLGTASPFNIITETFTLKNFTKEEITSLYQQHTDATGQIFEENAINYIYEQTCGQPWLVNAVVREIIVKILSSDYTQTITAEMAHTAIQTIILRRDTHIDSLLSKLKEPRVQNVIEPMLIGEFVYDQLSDDFQYVMDLGLIKKVDVEIIPSNPIYAEVIVRALNNDTQEQIKQKNPNKTVKYYLKDSKIDVNLLIQDFQQFWRENSDIWMEKFQYKEAAPHLILQAFLQRVINGGGDIIREPVAGRERADLCIVYQNNKYPIELKIWRGEKTLKEGLEQTLGYMDTFGSKDGWLLIFNRKPEISWDEKIYYKQEKINDKVINVFGL